MIRTEPDVAAVAALLGDRGRAVILMALMDGRALPAGELARIARITAQTASMHLGKLTASGLLTVERTGRHRYYRIAGPEISRAIEALGAIAAPSGEIRSLNASVKMQRLAHARTCYDHLAGRLSVQLAQILVARSVAEEYVVTPRGAELCVYLGVDSALSNPGVAVRTCIDWTERVPHVSGKLGREILKALFERGAILRTETPRVLRVTPEGETLFVSIVRSFRAPSNDTRDTLAI
jgi:DNA-binding transcriptional ArsR family regulator